MTAALKFHSGTGLGAPTPASFGSLVLNGSGIGLAWIQQARTTDPITRVRFRYTSRTGTPPAYVLTLETVDASGNPSGTDIGGGSPTAKIFTPPADATWDGTVQEITLTNAWTPSAQSDWFAITIRYSSGTVDGSNNSSISRSEASLAAAVSHTELPNSLSGGVWTKNGVVPCIGWGTASALYGKIYQSAYATVTANTAGRKSGLFFTLPSGFGSTFQLSHIAIAGKGSAASGSYKVGIWSTAGTELAIATVDGDISGGPTTNRQITAYFDSPVTLNYGTKYYAGIEVVSGTVYASGLECGDAAGMTLWPLGANSGLVTFDGSSWTETPTIYVPFELGFADITVPSGSGGGIVIGG